MTKSLIELVVVGPDWDASKAVERQISTSASNTVFHRIASSIQQQLPIKRHLRGWAKELWR